LKAPKAYSIFDGVFSFMLCPPAEQPGTPRWLHYCAVGTVCAALPLLVLGAEVTTKKVGMVDPKGFREPWHLFVVIAEKVERGETIELGFIIEHSHRLAGMVVGTLTIVLAIGLWLKERRLWLRWLGTLALAMVSMQGLLGKYRVDLNALMGRDLALIHGCFAQLVFALIAGVALFTSRGWSVPVEPAIPSREATCLWRWSLATSGLVFLQLVFGAVVRHRDVPFGARLHLLTAFGVVGAIVWLLKLVLDCQPRRRELIRPAAFLVILVGLQLILGMESWMTRFPSPMWNQVQPSPVYPELLRSLHYFVGALLFATTVIIALRAFRLTSPAVQVQPASVSRLEGAL
jgi:cytochrome c oxidase assembly protein subunit 15